MATSGNITAIRPQPGKATGPYAPCHFCGQHLLRIGRIARIDHAGIAGHGNISALILTDSLRPTGAGSKRSARKSPASNALAGAGLALPGLAYYPASKPRSRLTRDKRLRLFSESSLVIRYVLYSRKSDRLIVVCVAPRPFR